MISVQKGPLKCDWIYVPVVEAGVCLWTEHKTLVDDWAGVLLLVAVVLSPCLRLQELQYYHSTTTCPHEEWERCVELLGDEF